MATAAIKANTNRAFAKAHGIPIVRMRMIKKLSNPTLSSQEEMVSAGSLICKEWRAIGFSWRLLRRRWRAWYLLERDGQVIAESGDRRALLEQGWYS